MKNSTFCIWLIASLFCCTAAFAQLTSPASAVVKRAAAPSPCTGQQIWYNTGTNKYQICPAGVAADIGSSAGTPPGGNPSTVQWNNAGAFGGVAQWTTNGTTTLTGSATSVFDVSAATASNIKLPSGVVTLNFLADPGANKAFSMTSRTLNFNYGNFGAQNAFSVTSSGLSSGSNPLFLISTGAGSHPNQDPMLVCAQGTTDCLRMTNAAAVTTTGAATFDTTKLSVAAVPNGVTATTQAIGSNDNKLATDAFVLANAGSGTVAPTAQGLPVTCNGSNCGTVGLYKDVYQFSSSGTSDICASLIAASNGDTTATTYDARAFHGTQTCTPVEANGTWHNVPSGSTLLLSDITIKLGTAFRTTTNSGDCGAGNNVPCVAAWVLPNRTKIIGASPDSVIIQPDPANWAARSATIVSATVSGSGAQCTQAANKCWVHLTFSSPTWPDATYKPVFSELVQLQSTTTGTADSNSGMFVVCKSGNPAQNGGCQNDPTNTTVDFYNEKALATTNGGTVYFGTPLIAWGADALAANKFQGDGGVAYAQNMLLQNVGVNCNNVEGCIGFQDVEAQEHSQLKNFTGKNSPFAVVDFMNSGGSGFSNSGPHEDMYLLQSGGTPVCHYGTVMLHVGNNKAGLFSRATITQRGCTYSGYEPGTGTTGEPRTDILTDGPLAGNTFIGYHPEGSRDGILIGANAGTEGVTLIGLRGHSSIDNLVHISNNFNTATGATTINSLNVNGGTNSISDDPNSVVLTATNNGNVGYYNTDATGLSGVSNVNPVLSGSTCTELSNGTTFYNGGYYVCAGGVIQSKLITGALTLAADGTHPGFVDMVGNTTGHTVPANTFSLSGPNAATFTQYGLQFPTTGPTAGQIATFGTPDGTTKQSQVTFTTPMLASSLFANQGTTTTVLHGNAAGNPAFGPVVGADMTNNTVTATQLAAAQNTRTSCATDLAPVTGDDGLITLLNPATAVHLTRFSCGVTGTTSVIGNLVKAAASLVADQTCTAGDANQVNTTTFANGSGQCGGTTSCAVAAHAPVTIHIGTISGTPTGVTVCVDYTVD